MIINAGGGVGIPRALIVDDEPDLLELASVYLRQKSDFEVLTAQSAKEALKILEELEVDVIISDYQMPGMDGIQFLKKIRNKGNDIPFILFTAKDSEELAIEALNCGADFFVKKGGGGRALDVTDPRQAVRISRLCNSKE